MSFWESLTAWFRSLAQSKKVWLFAAVCSWLAARRLRRFAKLQHAALDDTSSPLRRQIQLDKFPEFIKSASGLWLYSKVWPVPQPRAVVVVSHGFGEHILRYEHVARFLNARGFMVCGIDHQGHGQSEGDRAHVVSFDDYVQDVNAFAKKVKSDNPSVPLFLIGHSMGGTVATQCARCEPDLFHGVVLSAPAFKPDPAIATPFMRFLARVMSRLVPKLPVERLPAKHVCSDPQVVARYETDPLVYHGGMRTNWAWQLLQTMEDIRLNADSVTFPFLLMHGTADRLSMFDGSERFFAAAKSTDKEFKKYWNFSHELFHEPKHGQVLDDVLAFLEAHISSA